MNQILAQESTHFIFSASSYVLFKITQKQNQVDTHMGSELLILICTPSSHSQNITTFSSIKVHVVLKSVMHVEYEQIQLNNYIYEMQNIHLIIYIAILILEYSKNEFLHWKCLIMLHLNILSLILFSHENHINKCMFFHTYLAYNETQMVYLLSQDMYLIIWKVSNIYRFFFIFLSLHWSTSLSLYIWPWPLLCNAFYWFWKKNALNNSHG